MIISLISIVLKKYNKLQNENVTLKRDKNKPAKPEHEIFPKKQQNISMRGSMYVPSTQRLIIVPKRRESKDTSLIGDLEPDEDKIKEIESNIFNKISQSVEKIFNLNSTESRMTFSIPKLNAGFDLDKNLRMQTVYEKENKRRKSIEDRFKEIAEASDEEERETFRFNMYVPNYRKSLCWNLLIKCTKFWSLMFLRWLLLLNS